MAEAKQQDEKPIITVNPYAIEYSAALYEVTKQFRSKYPDWWFTFTGQVEPVVALKAAKASHNTRPLMAADKAKVPPRG